ncbi:hypothetical protein BB559_004928 [Furculomyces boomerangus]|uniref:PB1 domain-containing protein n=1 Tax=Furculomyces boomerangus TaxID=61424 RepID=A0A2T9YBU3_9FUNG|nr:hypothetical protein BB559_004928 [Furculomyces boomerangus]
MIILKGRYKYNFSTLYSVIPGVTRWTNLQKEIKEKYGLAEHQRILLTYTDTDGDVVGVCCNHHLEEMLSNQKGKKIIRVRILNLSDIGVGLALDSVPEQWGSSISPYNDDIYPKEQFKMPSVLQAMNESSSMEHTTIDPVGKSEPGHVKMPMSDESGNIQMPTPELAILESAKIPTSISQSAGGKKPAVVNSISIGDENSNDSDTEKPSAQHPLPTVLGTSSSSSGSSSSHHSVHDKMESIKTQVTEMTTVELLPSDSVVQGVPKPEPNVKLASIENKISRQSQGLQITESKIYISENHTDSVTSLSNLGSSIKEVNKPDAGSKIETKIVEDVKLESTKAELSLPPLRVPTPIIIAQTKPTQGASGSLVKTKTSVDEVSSSHSSNSSISETVVKASGEKSGIIELESSETVVTSEKIAEEKSNATLSKPAVGKPAPPPVVIKPVEASSSKKKKEDKVVGKPAPSPVLTGVPVLKNDKGSAKEDSKMVFCEEDDLVIESGSKYEGNQWRRAHGTIVDKDKVRRNVFIHEEVWSNYKYLPENRFGFEDSVVKSGGLNSGKFCFGDMLGHFSSAFSDDE